jgi:hypothetical protein
MDRLDLRRSGVFAEKIEAHGSSLTRCDAGKKALAKLNNESSRQVTWLMSC